MLHHKAEEAIQKKLTIALNNCEVKGGYYQFHSKEPSVDNFLNEALKHIKEASYLDLLYAVQTHVNNLIDEQFEEFSDRQSCNGSLPELFGEDEINKLQSKILSYFSSLPHQYRIFFPLNGIETIYTDTLKITENMFLYEVHEGDGKLGEPYFENEKISFFNKREDGDIYLCIENKGSVVFTFENQLIYNSYSLFKQFIHAGLIKGALRTNHSLQYKNNSTIGLGLAKNKILVNNLDSELGFESLNLAPNVIEFVSKLEFDPEFFSFFRKESEVEDSTIVELAAGFISHEILDPEDPDRENLLTAIDWSFESRVNPNNTFGFIQLCIALEAILSDNTNSESITKTLADRAAYFLGESVKERRKIIDQFKELYSLRSKLVHGRKKNLNDQEQNLYHWGIDILNRIIRKEFDLLNE